MHVPSPPLGVQEPHSVKRFSLQCALFAGLLGALGLVGYVNGDGKGTRAAKPQPNIRLAVIDISHILKNYQKHEDLQQEVREAAEMAQNKAKGMIEQARSLQEQLQSGEFESDSDEFLKKERQVISLSSKFEVYNALTKKELTKKNAETMAKAYLDVQNAMALYAEQNGYTMIMRFQRDFEGLSERDRTWQTMSQSIVRYEGADDITDSVLAWLNQQYQAQLASAAPKKPATPAKSPTAAPAKAPATSSTQSALNKGATARKPQNPATSKTIR